MDRLTIVDRLGRVAHALNRLGLEPLTRRVARRAAVGGDLRAEVDGLALAGSFRHRGYLASMRDGNRERYMAELFVDAAEPGGVVLDVGACLGVFALLAARRVGAEGRVYAFEPNPRSYDYLVRNIAANGFEDRVEAVPKAVAGRPGRVAFFLNEVEESSSSLHPPEARSSRTVVDAVPIDSVIPPEARVKAIKLDVEGAEPDAIAGMARTLEGAAPNVRVFVECNPPLLERAGHSTENLLERLEEVGLAVQTIDEERRRLVPGVELGGAPYVNLLCERAGARGP